MGGNSQDGSSNSQTFVNITRVIIGMGILTMPSAMARIGVVPTMFISAVVPLLSYCTWTWAVEVKNKYSCSKSEPETNSTERDPLWRAEAAPESSSGNHLAETDVDSADPLHACLGGFDTVVQHVLGAPGRLLFIMLVMLVQFSAGISYISAMDEGLRIIFPTVSQNMGLALITFVLMGTTLIAPNLRDIAFLSFASTLVLVYMFFSMPLEGLHRSHQHAQEPLVLWDFSATYLDWGYTFGAVGFSYCGFACGLCLYEDMKHKEDYHWVTGAAFVCSAFLAMVFGFVGYWAFGGSVKELVYLNFPAGSMTSYICIVAYSLILLATYLVMVTPVFLVARGLLPSTPYGVIRCVVIALTAMCSKMLPSVMQVLLLLNIISAQLSELAIPAYCYLRKGDHYNFVQRCVAYMCIATAIVGGAAGFMSAIDSFKLPLTPTV